MADFIAVPKGKFLDEIGTETMTTDAQTVHGAVNELDADVSQLNNDLDGKQPAGNYASGNDVYNEFLTSGVPIACPAGTILHYRIQHLKRITMVVIDVSLSSAINQFQPVITGLPGMLQDFPDGKMYMVLQAVRHDNAYVYNLYTNPSTNSLNVAGGYTALPASRYTITGMYLNNK